MSEPTAYVYLEVAGTPALVGALFAGVTRGREMATFRYAPSWVARPDALALAPALHVSPGPFYTAPGHALFGALSDSAPDRWGQSLMRRAERQRAAATGTPPRTLRAVDFLLGVSDQTRQGALRFARTDGGPFEAPDDAHHVPPLVDLPRLLDATDRFLADEDSADDLHLLLAPGSSLGGARPKASVRDPQGALWIAKFPKRDDAYRVVAWEAVALDLARAAGIPTPAYRLEQVAGRDVLLVRRFDRTDSGRTPYLSAMSMLDAFDGDVRSYVEIADVIRQHGARVPENLADLWRRLVCSVLLSNTDDHLRNHGFLYTGRHGWALSPVFDVNPVPTDLKARVLSTTIDVDGDPTASLALARAAAPQFDLDAARADAIIRHVSRATATWRAVAASHGIRGPEIARMASAFEHADAQAAATV